MPLYQTRCNSCHVENQVFRKIDDRDDLPGCACGGVPSRVISAPTVKTDIEPYQSPSTGKWVSSRAGQRQDLAEAGAFLYEPGVKEDIARNKVRRFEKDFAPIASAVDDIVRDMAVSGKLEI